MLDCKESDPKGGDEGAFARLAIVFALLKGTNKGVEQQVWGAAPTITPSHAVRSRRPTITLSQTALCSNMQH